jgi:hypothetical protein
MLLVVAALFIVSWTPTMTLYYEYFLHRQRFFNGPGVTLFQSSSLLIFGHSVMNPVTYIIMSSSFRANAKAALLWWCPGYKKSGENSVTDQSELTQTK